MGYCSIHSVPMNIGHLSRVSSVARYRLLYLIRAQVQELLKTAGFWLWERLWELDVRKPVRAIEVGR